MASTVHAKASTVADGIYSKCGSTGAEEDDGLEAAVLGRVDVQRLELLDLFLEDADVVHEGDDAVGGHGTCVEAGGGEQRRHVERHRALRRVEDEQLTPAQPQQTHLVRRLATTPRTVCHTEQTRLINNATTQRSAFLTTHRLN